ncbi:hypothetical protein MMPV_009989, partial [Pyropia vietnamensis]
GGGVLGVAASPVWGPLPRPRVGCGVFGRSRRRLVVGAAAAAPEVEVEGFETGEARGGAGGGGRGVWGG